MVVATESALNDQREKAQSQRLKAEEAQAQEKQAVCRLEDSMDKKRAWNGMHGRRVAAKWKSLTRMAVAAREEICESTAGQATRQTCRPYQSHSVVDC